MFVSDLRVKNRNELLRLREIGLKNKAQNDLEKTKAFKMFGLKMTYPIIVMR